MTETQSGLDYILETPVAPERLGGRLPVQPAIQCRDGFRVSVQASKVHYCFPRDDWGPWYMVELGHPSEPLPESFLQHAEDPSQPLETVYVWVPVEMVRELIASHGGEVDQINPPTKENKLDRINSAFKPHPGGDQP